MRRVLFLTGTRADFGKLQPLMRCVENSSEFECQVFVTGMHTLQLYGYTAKALVSVTDAEHHPLKMLLRCSNGEIRPVSTWQDMTAARQVLPEALRVNGAIYFVDWAYFLEVGTVFSDPTGIYRMSRESSIDIDNMDDLAEAARILRRQG